MTTSPTSTATRWGFWASVKAVASGAFASTVVADGTECVVTVLAARTGKVVAVHEMGTTVWTMS